MRKLYSLFLASLLLIFFSSLSFAETINWHPYTNAAFAEAKKQNKLVLIFGKVSWCHWCKQMRDETFTNNEVAHLINKKFIPITVDLEENAEVADKFGINMFPTLIILDHDQKVVKSQPGYMTAEETISFLDSKS